MTVVPPAAKYAEAPAQLNMQDQSNESSDSARRYGVGTVNILPFQPGNTTRVIVEGEPSRRRVRN
jgi:hypothetical protein